MTMQAADFKVGQIWEDKSGEFICIETIGMGSMQSTAGLQYGEDGHCRCLPAKNLVRQMVEAGTGSLPENAAPTTVGDINSTDKGSGARYNAGKPPYDLVPLQMMADWYAQDDSECGCGDCMEPTLALSELGEFQARSQNADLMRVLLALGDGWEECARVFEYGRHKYAAWNWSKGMAWSVPIARATRHLLALIKGETLDPESGLAHRGHVYCNIVMLYTFCETYEAGDDRPPTGSLAIDFDQLEVDSSALIDMNALMRGDFGAVEIDNAHVESLLKDLARRLK